MVAALALLLAYGVIVIARSTGTAGSSIETYGEALWWATVMVTTVEYGDYSPVTPVGRAIAVGLMIAGIALLGVVTATLVSWIVARVSEQDDANQTVTRARVSDLVEEIAALRRALSARDARGGPPGDSPHDRPGGSSVSSGP